MGDVLKPCHDCKFPPLCTPFMYTAVGNLLPAQGFIPPVAMLRILSFFGGVLKRSRKFTSSTRFYSIPWACTGTLSCTNCVHVVRGATHSIALYPTRGTGVDFTQLLLVLNGGVLKRSRKFTSSTIIYPTRGNNFVVLF